MLLVVYKRVKGCKGGLSSLEVADLHAASMREDEDLPRRNTSAVLDKSSWPW